jgi:hypothetical protein
VPAVGDLPLWIEDGEGLRQHGENHEIRWPVMRQGLTLFKIVLIARWAQIGLQGIETNRVVALFVRGYAVIVSDEPSYDKCHGKQCQDWRPSRPGEREQLVLRGHYCLLGEINHRRRREFRLAAIRAGWRLTFGIV